MRKPYSKKIKKFRATLIRLLGSLAKDGCGDGGWCECLLCRVMRIVQTEQYRNEPLYKSSCPPPSQTATQNTKMIEWRGGLIEFARGTKEYLAKQPWYGIKIQHTKESEPYLWWLDYCGPPHLYLTRKMAVKYAKQLRKQYHCIVKVVKIGEI
jgi:hypothetical protein